MFCLQVAKCLVCMPGACGGKMEHAPLSDVQEKICRGKHVCPSQVFLLLADLMQTSPLTIDNSLIVFFFLGLFLLFALSYSNLYLFYLIIIFDVFFLMKGYKGCGFGGKGSGWILEDLKKGKP